MKFRKKRKMSLGERLKCWLGFHEWTKEDVSRRRYCKRCGETEYYVCRGFLFENPVMESGHCGWHPLTKQENLEGESK